NKRSMFALGPPLLATLFRHAGRGKGRPARIPQNAQKSIAAASPVSADFGTKRRYFERLKKFCSYFLPLLAPEKKIISLAPTCFTRSTDHVDNRKLADGAPFLARL